MNTSLPHTLTYWAPSGNDGTYAAYGAQGFASPVTILGRWQRGLSFGRQNDAAVSAPKAVAITRTAVQEGGYLYKGTSTATNPETVSGAYMITRADTVEALDGSDTLTQALCGG